MSQHTPLPWTYATDGNAAHLDYTVRDANGWRVANVYSTFRDEANAAFVVRACNNHDALVEIAEWAESALSFLSIKATSVEDRAEFKRRFAATRAALQSAKVD